MHRLLFSTSLAILRPNIIKNINKLQCNRTWQKNSKKYFCITTNSSLNRLYSTSIIDEITYENISEETLDSLTEYLEDLVERDDAPPDSDVMYSSGVITLSLGSAGTYVINKQTPNKQIWLSSPTSGPKRYDFSDGVWIYKHDGETLHTLLQKELSEIFKHPLDVRNCEYGLEKS